MAIVWCPAAGRVERPWKNGGGMTADVAASPPGAGMDGFDWRVSIARVEADGPFSVFPGVDRTMALHPSSAEELVTLRTKHASSDPIPEVSAGTNFLSKVGTTMGAANVKMPEPADGVMGGAVSYAYIAGDVIASLGIDTGVPGRMTGSAGTGLLPLYVTFNLPRGNQLVAPKWDAFLKEWRDTGNVQSLFASTFSLYLQDAFGNNLDLVEWLKGQSAYAKTVKVFVDEQRSVLTVSFIVMLMDGPSATVRLVDDTTTSTNNSHIVVMDGNANNRWNMKFFVAPAGYVPTDRKPASDGGSSGCNGLTLGIVLLLACIPARIKWR